MMKTTRTLVIDGTYAIPLMQEKIGLFIKDQNSIYIVRDEILIQIFDNLFDKNHFLKTIQNKQNILEFYVDNPTTSFHKLSIPNIKDPLVKNILSELYREIGLIIFLSIQELGLFSQHIIFNFQAVDYTGIYCTYFIVDSF